MAATRAIGEYGDLTDFLGIESKDAA
jgi:hypothetical protein